MKQTFKIPNGCKEVTIEQVGNQIVTTFEPKKYTPKVGDCVKITYDDDSFFFLRISRVDGCNLYVENVHINKKGILFKSGNSSFYESIEKITPEQFQAEFEKLGYIYDFETNTASKKRWRAEEDGEYYFMLSSFEIRIACEYNCETDDLRFKNGNYYKTQQQAEQYRDFMLQKSLEFNINNK